MNCDQTKELLPWLLNGTLGEDERRAALEHLQGCASCRQALGDTRLAWRIFNQHIPAAALVAYAADTAGEAPEGISREVLEEHLAACPDCAAELELVRTSRGLTEDDRIATFAPRTSGGSSPVRRTAPGSWRAAALAAGLTGLVALGGWYHSAEQARDLSHRLASTAEPAQRPAPVFPPAGTPPQAAPDARVAELQTQLETMQKTVGDLQKAEAEARQQLAQLSERPAVGPQLNAWVGDIQRSGDVLRGPGSSSDSDIPAGAAATLLLAAQRDAPGERDVEIADAGGKTVWTGGGLRMNPQSADYSLTLPAGWLTPGTYTIRLFRKAAGQRLPAEMYTIRVK